MWFVLRFVATVLAIVFIVSGARAVDSQGRFAVEGVGFGTCEQFSAAMEERSGAYFRFGGWLEGYITASNRYIENTYDLTPWQTTDLLISLIGLHCRSNPTHQFYHVVLSLIQELETNRLVVESPVRRAQANDTVVVIYDEVLRRVQAELKALDFYSGPIDGLFGEATSAALANFQESRQLTKTGLPDQATLLRLFRGESAN